MNQTIFIIKNPKISEELDNPWGSNLLIGYDKDNGLIKVPFEELVQIEVQHFKFKDSTRNFDYFMVTCNTTKGEEVFELADIMFIGDLNKWAEEADVKIEIR